MANVFLFSRRMTDSNYQRVWASLRAAGHTVYRGETYDERVLDSDYPLRCHSAGELESFRALGVNPELSEERWFLSPEQLRVLLQKMDVFVAIQSSSGALDFEGSGNCVEWMVALQLFRSHGQPKLLYLGSIPEEKTALAFYADAKLIDSTETSFTDRLLEMVVVN